MEIHISLKLSVYLTVKKKGSTPKILKASNLLIKKPMVMWSIAAAYVT